MATLMAVYNSDGCVGRCDATCYNAKHKKCTCICGGKNHGVGKAKAEQQVREGVGADGPSQDFIDRNELRPGKEGDWTMINRLLYPDARRARQEAYMRINQHDLFPTPEAG